MRFNDLPASQPVDTYTPKIDAKWAVLGEVEVRSGANSLRLEAAGRNPASSGYYAGIDAVVLAPVR